MTLCNLILKRQDLLSLGKAEGLGRSFALSSNLQVSVQVTLGRKFALIVME